MVWVGDSCFETKESQSVVRKVWSVSIQVRVEVELRTERISFGILSSVQKSVDTLEVIHLYNGEGIDGTWTLWKALTVIDSKY